jgi:glycosyltransferase involved in cell wall biosynthesis
MVNSSRPLKVQLIAKPCSGMTGTSRYTDNLYQGLRAAGLDACMTFPKPVSFWPPIQDGLKRLGVDVKPFFASYPLNVRDWQADIYHITTQTFASLLMAHRFKAPVVVTVLDIIPYLVRHHQEFNSFRHPLDYAFYRFSLAGLKRASAWVAISEYTKRTLVETLGLPADRVHVVYPHIDQAVFRPQSVPGSFLEKYGLNRHHRHILYVGTNDPRKNLRTLIQAFALLKQKCEGIKLIKVGSDCFPKEHDRIGSLVAQKGLQEDVLSFECVPDGDLVHFYNFSDLFVLPSFYEGFGLPVLEAMACGTPVICSRTTSLPEVGGDAVRYVDPISNEELAKALEEILEDQGVQRNMSEKGILQANTFNGINSIEMVTSLYTRMN